MDDDWAFIGGWWLGFLLTTAAAYGMVALTHSWPFLWAMLLTIPACAVVLVATVGVVMWLVER